jgi:peptidoglycan/LPS O-acetylase OafA/YrhL
VLARAGLPYGRAGQVTTVRDKQATETGSAHPGPLSAAAGRERSFRPDVEGLRAIAVGLVVLYHAGVPKMGGGYVGVDVFFVLSGFLITGLLIRERLTRGSNSLPGFYARRARRILPVATIVLMVTVLASYHWLGFLRAGVIAEDGKWTATFLANIRFALQGTQYLTASAPPSPLQHYWSLAVEEQFYLVWPALFLLVAAIARGAGLRLKLATVLAFIIGASFAWSVIETRQNGTWAFFSPLTRAWELGLGAMLAVATPAMLRLPQRLGAWLSWAGVVAVVGSAFLISATTAFPGYAAALPVLGTVAVVAGGTIRPGGGAEILLRQRPMQWLGKLSYSLYLWHWPLLTIAAQRQARPLTVGTGLLWVAVALVLSAVVFWVIENPVRYAKPLTKSPLLSLAMGAVLVVLSFTVCSWEIRRHETHRSSAAVASGSGAVRDSRGEPPWTAGLLYEHAPWGLADRWM